MIIKRNNILNKNELSKVITDKVIKLDIYKKSRVIALYNSMNNEVDTKDLINKSLKDKIVLLPKITKDKMLFIKINKNTNYIKNTFGILEPIGEIYGGPIDLIIVPGVSFDKKLNRLGFGKGYYDKYLNNKNIYKIGLSFSEQIKEIIPCDKHDIKMDMIITENKIYK